MRALRNNRQLKRLLYSWPVLVLLFAVAFLMVRATWSAYQKEAVSLEGLKETKSEWQRLSDREAELNVAVERLETPRGLEEEIREKFSVAKEGEKMAIVVEGNSTREKETVVEDNFLRRLWNFLLGR